MHPEHSHDEQFQRAVVRAAETMNETPYACERLQKAADLVLTGSVTLNGNGSATVKSGSHTYQFDPQNGCTCADSQHRSTHCKHTIAVELLKRTQTLMQGQESGIDPVPLAEVPQAAPQPTAWECAQAPSSCTMKWNHAGIELLLTLRAANDADLFSRIKHILPNIQEKVHHNGNGPTQDVPQCAIHNVPMKRYTKGDQAWYSHQTPDGTWCRGT
jgi:hypothetical protein